jgi:hypothetical protein
MDTMTTSTTAATESTGTSELTTQTTGPTTARRHRKLQRMISGLLALLGLSLIGLTAAPAAQAAGTSTLTACFKTTVNVYGIGPVSGPYTRPVMLDASNGSQSWLGLWSESPSMRGCLPNRLHRGRQDLPRADRVAIRAVRLQLRLRHHLRAIGLNAGMAR